MPFSRYCTYIVFFVCFFWSPDVAAHLSSADIGNEAENPVPTPNWECTIRSSLDGEIPGYTWIAFQNGQIIDSLSVGYARAPWDTTFSPLPMSTHTPIHLAGLSKLITAVAILQLAQDDFTVLDQAFWNVIKDHPLVTDNPAEAIQSISIWDLLAERSGMLTETDVTQAFWDQVNMVLESNNVMPVFIRTKQRYDIQYALLQLIVEIWSGMSYGEYVQANILQPLGINYLTLTPDESSTSLSYPEDLLYCKQGLAWGTIPFAPGSNGWVGSADAVARLIQGINQEVLLGPEATTLFFSEATAFFPREGDFGTYLHVTTELTDDPAFSFNKKGFSTSYFRFSDGYEIILLANGANLSLDLLLSEAFESSCSPCAVAGPGILAGCQDQNLTLDGTVSGGEGLVYEWSRRSGAILSGGNTLTPTVASPGLYTLQVTDTATGCVARSTVKVAPGNATVEVPDIPTAQNLSCINNMITLNPNAVENEDISYLWETNIGRIINGSDTPSPTVDAPGIYFATVSNISNNCTATQTIVVNSDRSIPRIEVTELDTINCKLDPVVLDASGSDTGEQFSYQWSTLSGNIVGPTDQLQATVDHPGTYTLLVENTTNGCTNSEDVRLIQGEIDTQLASSVEICPGEDFMGFTETGIIRDTLISGKACLITIYPLSVLPENHPDCQTTGTKNDLAAEAFQVFPNPTANRLNIKYSGVSHPIFTFTDLSGQILTRGVLSSAKSADIDLRSYAPGMYFLHLLYGEGAISTFKIIKL